VVSARRAGGPLSGQPGVARPRAKSAPMLPRLRSVVLLPMPIALGVTMAVRFRRGLPPGTGFATRVTAFVLTFYCWLSLGCVLYFFVAFNVEGIGFSRPLGVTLASSALLWLLRAAVLRLLRVGRRSQAGCRFNVKPPQTISADRSKRTSAKKAGTRAPCQRRAFCSGGTGRPSGKAAQCRPRTPRALQGTA